MRALLLLGLVLSLSVSATYVTAQETSKTTISLTNGLWFDGQNFVAASFNVKNGVFTAGDTAVADSVIDLAGHYVIPPFAEAHNHNVEGSGVQEIIDRYLEAGIFYVKNPNSLARTVDPIRSLLNTPTSIDVTFAGGGLTTSGGHPWALVRRNIERGNWTEADGESAFVHTIDGLADLDAKWPAILDARPDFIKTYLLYSEEYEQRRHDDAAFGWKGLDPDALLAIVERAHRDGLRVTTHVETATDFHYAIEAGVDEINHLPGFRPEEREGAGDINPQRFLISESDARRAGEQGTVVVTTLGPVLNALQGGAVPEELAKWYLDVLENNVAILRRYDVPIAIGSDNYRETALYEARALAQTGWIDSRALLKAWTENTPATIFPHRRIGKLKSGYEASLLVLEGDPIADFSNVERIVMRMKQGVILDESSSRP